MEFQAINSDEVDVTGHGYPRPQLRRATWYSLNGEWEFALDAASRWSAPAEVDWRDRIRVPYAPESRASGIGNTGLYRTCWYRRSISLADRPDGGRVLLRFGAVDYHAAVWVNGLWVGDHEGGYTPFSFDVTSCINESSGCEVVVCAIDDPTDLAKPRGKQDWELKPHSIWYPRTTGIWQSVWLEIVPATALQSVAFTPNLGRWEIDIAARIDGVPREPCRLAVTLTSRGTLLAADTYSVVSGEVHRRIALSDPGIDDSRNELLWSPDSPNLIDVQLDLWGERNELLDHAMSYTALRSTAAEGDRFVLNGRPYVLRLVLDQGYWPESGATAPDDAALRRDVMLAKQMGFNGARKHQKIEDPRYLFWADRIGLAVWEEMPSAYRFTRRSVELLTREWSDVIARDYSHPCIIAWVPINESWGVPNLPSNPSERHYVKTLYHLTRTLDATRPVIGNDGWESIATDIIGIHDYDDQPERIAKRYHADELLPRLFTRERPGGRWLVLEGQARRKPAVQPLMLTEFGGLMFSRDPGTWGYSRCNTPQELAKRYRDLLEVVRNLHVLSGFCYTQFADTYQEANGLLFADRTPKVPLEEIAAATRGPTAKRTEGLEQLQPIDEGVRGDY
jgi:beta-galactosidase/beta-glucuronidase